MRIERILREGKELAVIPVSDLQKLIAASEMLSDVQAYDAAKNRLERGEDEIIPFEIVKRRVAGERPVKIWRSYRDVTQERLAERSGVSRVMIAAIESGQKRRGVGTLKKLAAALGVNLENIA